MTSPFAPAIREAYKRGEEEETLQPLVLVDGDGKPVGRIGRGDSLIFYNIRGEREIELSDALTDPGFTHFGVVKDLGLNYSTMIEYAPHIPARVAFPPLGVVENTLSEVVSKAGLRQAKIVESEKAVHLSFFLNGKRNDPFPGEDRIFPDSRKDVVNYNEIPEMSIAEVTEAAKRAIEEGKHDLIVTNFANTDVLGHIIDEEAIRKGLAAVDRHAGILLEAAEKAGMCVVITADHGTVERWKYPDGAIDTGHTTSPVPFVLCDFRPGAPEFAELASDGSITNVAPTILHLLGIEKPAEMTAGSLLDGDYPKGGAGKTRAMLLILDGWGHSDETEGNLIAAAETPVMDRVRAGHPNTLIEASQEAVGLPEGTVGNSESGHLHLGAGRIVPSDRNRIRDAIKSGEYFENEAFLAPMRAAKEKGRPLHLLGIVSFFSSHGSVEYLYALLELAKQEKVPEVYIHSLVGRRGEYPESGVRYIEDVEKKAREIGVGRVVTVMGRFWAMDREENWDRIEKTYRALVHGEGIPVPDIM
jgi:2,3-bisphosphoglycerate-independent phosphoglycerate mutase